MALFNGKNLLEMKPEDRSHEGLFLSFQYPVEIPGVSMTNFMKAAINAKRAYEGLEPMKAAEFMALMREKRQLVGMDSTLSRRSVNEGFSGGEKKRNEIFQMATRLILKSSDKAPWSDNGSAKNPALLPLKKLGKGLYFYEVDLEGIKGKSDKELLDLLKANGTQSYKATIKVYSEKDGKADLTSPAFSLSKLAISPTIAPIGPVKAANSGFWDLYLLLFYHL